MKLIVATVRSDKLDAVVQALRAEPGVSVLNVTRVADVREPSSRELWRGLEVRVPRPRLRLEVIVVNETLVSSTVRSISRAAATNGAGRVGDGDIVVMPVDDYLRLPVVEQEHWSEDEAAVDTLPPISLDRV